MKVTAETYGHAVVLNMNGELTEDTLEVFRQVVVHQLKDANVVDLVMNLEAVPFIDSAGLEYLLEVQEELAGRFGQVKLVECDENVQKILEITDLRSTFEQYERTADAVKAVQA